MSNRALDALPVEDATVIPSARLLLPGTSSSALYPSANERSDRGENLCPRPVRSASPFLLALQPALAPFRLPAALSGFNDPLGDRGFS